MVWISEWRIHEARQINLRLYSITSLDFFKCKSLSYNFKLNLRELIGFIRQWLYTDKNASMQNCLCVCLCLSVCLARRLQGLYVYENATMQGFYLYVCLSSCLSDCPFGTAMRLRGLYTRVQQCRTSVWPFCRILHSQVLSNIATASRWWGKKGQPVNK